MEVGMMSDTSGEHSCLSFWDLDTGVLKKSYRNGCCMRNAVAFVGDSYIAAGQHGKQLAHFYDTDKEQLVKKIVCPGKVSALTVSPDGHYCVVALEEKIYIWQLCTGNLIKVLSKHYQQINCIRFTQDGSFFLTCGNDNLLLVWNFYSACQPKTEFDANRTETAFHTISHHSLPIKDMHVGVGGMRCHVVSCSLDQTCKLYDVSSGELLCSFVFETPCTAVGMDTAETTLFVGTCCGKIYFVNLFENDSRREVEIPAEKVTLQAHTKEVTGLSCSMDASKLLSGSRDGKVKLWHITSRQCLRTFPFKGEVTNSVILPFPAFLRDNRTPPKSKVPVQNFKRTVHDPCYDHADFDSSELNDVTPMKLKDSDKSFYERFLMEKDTSENLELIDSVLAQCPDSSNLSSKTATHAELIERVNSLESLTKELYTFAYKRIVDEG